MRGRHKLYLSSRRKSPEAADRLRQRDTIWAARYYYYSYLVTPRMGYEDIIHTIAIELGYYSPRTITDVLTTRCSEEIKRLQASATTVADLQRSFPWYSWKPYELKITDPAQASLFDQAQNPNSEIPTPKSK